MHTSVISQFRCAALLLLVSVLSPCAAAAIPAVTVTPATSSVQPGDLFFIDVRVSAEADTISNYNVILQFDPTVVELMEVVQGSLYQGYGDFSWFESTEESLGTWQVFDVIFPAESFVLAPGELCRLHFHALSVGYSPVTILTCSIKDIGRYPIEPLSIESGVILVGDVVSVGPAEIPWGGWDLGAPFPNPAAGSTEIMLYRTGRSDGALCRLGVFDIAGRRIRVLDPGAGGGNVRLAWDGRDDRGVAVCSGAYFIRLEGAGRLISRKIVLLR